MQPMYADSLGGFQLQVHRKDFIKAAAVLREGGYAVENGHYENEEYVEEPEKVKGRNEIRRVFIWALIFIIGAALVFKVLSVKTEMETNNVAKELIKHRWCVEKIVSAGRELTPLTIKNGDKVSLARTVRCEEAFLFAKGGGLVLPGFQSDNIISTWRFDEEELVLKNIDTLGDVFDQSYSVELTKERLHLKSKVTNITCKKQSKKFFIDPK